jgi:ankyrin repeat protein
LIEAGANVLAEDEYGVGVLFGAILNGHAEVVELLIDHGADVNAATRSGLTPYRLAEDVGDMQVASILLREGAY